MRPSAVSGLLIFAIAASACTVKEDRTFCPAWCVLYSDGHVAEGCSGDLTCNVATDEENSVEFGQKDYSSFTSRGDLVLEIPRNENVYLDVFCGVDEMARTGPVLAIPMGFCCDSIYSGHGRVFIAGEEGEAGLPLNKDFATVTLKVKGEVEGEYPFCFRIRGKVDGFELPGGRPHRGEFDYRPPEEAGPVFRARIPRQLDDSLELEISHKDDGSVLTVQSLGAMLMKAGYDWTVQDLKDIEIGIDLSESAFTIEIADWEVSETLKIIL